MQNTCGVSLPTNSLSDAADRSWLMGQIVKVTSYVSQMNLLWLDRN